LQIGPTGEFRSGPSNPAQVDGQRKTESLLSHSDAARRAEKPGFCLRAMPNYRAARILERTIMTLLALKPGAVLLIAASLSPCQAPLSAQNAQENESHHLLWIIPNYRTSPTLTDYSPLTVREKFRIAGEDSWDRGTVALSALFAVTAQAANSNRSFGQGTAGYAQYLGASYGDFVVGNYMSEGVLPSLLHQDPRYFRRGAGSGWSRLRYSLSQSFITRGDSGHIQPNYSEWLGNSAAVAISNAYYADHRTAHEAATELCVQVGVDAAANVLKEFYPDLETIFRRKHRREKSSSSEP
jgi:hypothetical protein